MLVLRLASALLVARRELVVVLNRHQRITAVQLCLVHHGRGGSSVSIKVTTAAARSLQLQRSSFC